MLNLVVQTGRLVNDPELRYTKHDQTPVTSFRIAVKRDYARDGEPDTDFFDVVAWRSTAEFICKYFEKGSMIQVVGNLQNRPWKDKHDQNRVATEIIVGKAYFGESKGKDDDSGNINAFDDSPAPADTGFSNPPDFDPFS